MIKKLIVLFAVLAMMAGALFLDPNLEIQIGKVPQSVGLSVKARDLELVCPGPLYKAGGVNGNSL